MCMHFAICNFHLADKFEKISMTEEDRFSKVNGEQLLLEPGANPKQGRARTPGGRQSVGGHGLLGAGQSPASG